VTAVRVARLITRLNIGGPAYQAIYLSQRLQDSEFTSHLISGTVGGSEGSMEPLAAERGVVINRVPELGREVSAAADLRAVHSVFRLLRRIRPWIVHTHLAKAGTVGRVAARLARVPTVVHTYHGHVFHGYFSPRKTQLFIRIEQALARWTDRLVVLGPEQEREILGHGVGRAAQMVRIPLGLELEPFLTAESLRGTVRAELGIAPDAPVVGIVARLVPIKCHDLFLNAAALVAQKLPAAQFFIVGDGELREPLQRRAAAFPREIRERIRFLGFRSDLPALYSDLDVVVLSSRNEGLPVTLIEALAAARPVVATDVGEVRSLITPGVTGLVVPLNDATAMATAIGGLVDDPGRAAAMGSAGRAHVYPRLSIDRLESDIRKLYRELLPTRRG
jgi:glycosyltransferase involved in cell wall biosynthesis